MGVSIILPIVTIFVLLRLYTKARINKFGLGKEDCKYLYVFPRPRRTMELMKLSSLDACFLGYVGLIVFDYLEMRQLHHGLGVHQYNVPVIDGMHFAQVSLFCQLDPFTGVTSDLLDTSGRQLSVLRVRPMYFFHQIGMNPRNRSSLSRSRAH